MPRKRPQTVTRGLGSTVESGKADLQRGINSLLTVANQHVDLDPDALRLAAHAHGFLEWARVQDWAKARELERVKHVTLNLSRFGPPGWPEWAAVAASNIVSHLKDGLAHLRRCDGCKRWMFIEKGQRYICNRAGCAGARNAQFQRDYRKRVFGPPKTKRR